MEKTTILSYNMEMRGRLKEAQVSNCLYRSTIHVVDDGSTVQTEGVFNDLSNLVILGLCGKEGRNLNQPGISVERKGEGLATRCDLVCSWKG